MEEEEAWESYMTFVPVHGCLLCWKILLGLQIQYWYEDILDTEKNLPETIQSKLARRYGSLKIPAKKRCVISTLKYNDTIFAVRNKKKKCSPYVKLMAPADWGKVNGVWELLRSVCGQTERLFDVVSAIDRKDDIVIGWTKRQYLYASLPTHKMVPNFHTDRW